jgi:hypothetical protein
MVKKVFLIIIVAIICGYAKSQNIAILKVKTCLGNPDKG